MATSKYTVDPSNVIPSLVNALNAKGLISSIKYQSSTHLIFSTPLTTKIIKFWWNNDSNTEIYLYYGDEWTSGTAITNEVTFLKSYHGTGGYLTGIDVFADSNFFLIVWHTSNMSQYAVGYVGSLNNGDKLVFGLTAYDSGTFSKAMNLTDNIQLYPVGLQTVTGIRDAGGNLMSIPLMWTDTIGALEMNGENPAETVGIRISSVISTGSTSVYSGNNYFLTPSKLYMSGLLSLTTALLIEYGL